MRRPRLHALGRSQRYVAATAVALCVLSSAAAAAADDVQCGTQIDPVIQRVHSSYTADQVVRLSNKCDNGHFNISWDGKFTLSDTLHVRAGSTVNITGADDQAEISGGNTVRLFTVASGATLHLQNLTLRDGYYEFDNHYRANQSEFEWVDGGAAVKAFEGSRLTVEDCRFYTNTVRGLTDNLGGACGGAIFATAADVSVTWSIFEGNAVPGNSPNLTRANYTGADYDSFYNSTAFFIDKDKGVACYGGAIFATNESTLRVEDTAFKRNIATNGAAIASTNKTRFQIMSSEFTEQIGRPFRGGGEPGLGSSKGAGVYVHQPGPGSIIENSQFTANLAAFGASIYYTQRTDEFGIITAGDGSAFSETCPTNVTKTIEEAGSSELNITGSIFNDNVASGNTYSNSGGILMERGVVVLRANNCTFDNNTAPSSAVVQLQADTNCHGTESDMPYENVTAIFADCEFSNNNATGNGGGSSGGGVLGTYAAVGHIEFRSCRLHDNLAFGDGVGGVAKFTTPDTLISDTDFSVEAYDTVFSRNSAGTDGGVLNIGAPRYLFSFSNTTFEYNTAGRKAGAIYSGQNANFTLVNCTLQHNNASTSGGAIALEPLSPDAALRGTDTTFINNTAVFSGGAVHCDHLNLFEPNDWIFIDNASPLGQIVLLWSNINATRVLISQNTNSTSQQQTSAGILASASALVCVECEFVGFTGSSSVVALGYNATATLDSCRFVEANISTFIASTDGEGAKVLKVRNAELGRLAYVRAGYDPHFADDDISLRSCDDFTSDDCEECTPSDFGVICGSFYDVLDVDRRSPWSITSENVTAVSCSAPDNSSETNRFVFQGRESRPQFSVNVTAPSWSSGMRLRSYWNLKETGKPSDNDWIFQPSVSLLRAKDLLTVNVTAGASSLSSLDGKTTVSNITLTDIMQEPLKDISSQHLYITSTYYYCEGGEYTDSSGGDDTCKTCAVDLQGDPRGVKCSETHGENLESLLLSKGYWRENATSQDILKCYNRDACTGGSTPDTYCKDGYTGPYCAACEDNYASTGLTYKCIDCTQQQRSAVFTILAILGAICILFIAAILSADNPVQCVPLGSVLGYVAASGPYIAGIWGKIPFAKLRIPLITLQILTQYSLVCNVQYPSFFEAFLRAMSVINLDFTIGVSAACLWPSANYYDRLLIITLTPLVLVLLGGCFMWWWRRRRVRRMRLARRRIGGRPTASAAAAAAAASSPSASERTSRQEESKPNAVSLWSCLVTVAIPVSFLVYSACSTAIFAAFQCDENAEVGTSYLRADYSITCGDGKYKAFRFYAAVMVAVYPVGTPILFAWQLHQRSMSRKAGAPVRSVSDSAVEPAFLGEPVAHPGSSSSIVRSGRARAEQQYTEFLWKPYRTKRHYYEVVECFRRLLMTGILVFLSASMRPTFGTLFAAAFLVVYSGLKPFQAADDSQSYLTGLGAVWLQAFLSLTISAEIVASDGSTANVAASCIITLVVLSWVMVVWQAVLAARGSVAVVSESLHPLWNSSIHRIPSFFNARESEEEAKAPEEAPKRSSKHATDNERAAPAWGGY